MQGRAVQLGGTLSFETRPGHGTKVLLDIPLRS
jgi:signal transduction histidine kinase